MADKEEYQGGSSFRRPEDVQSGPEQNQLRGLDRTNPNQLETFGSGDDYVAGQVRDQMEQVNDTLDINRDGKVDFRDFIGASGDTSQPTDPHLADRDGDGEPDNGLGAIGDALKRRDLGR